MERLSHCVKPSEWLPKPKIIISDGKHNINIALYAIWLGISPTRYVRANTPFRESHGGPLFIALIFKLHWQTALTIGNTIECRTLSPTIRNCEKWIDIWVMRSISIGKAFHCIYSVLFSGPTILWNHVRLIWSTALIYTSITCTTRVRGQQIRLKRKSHWHQNRSKKSKLILKAKYRSHLTLGSLLGLRAHQWICCLIAQSFLHS